MDYHDSKALTDDDYWSREPSRWRKFVWKMTRLEDEIAAVAFPIFMIVMMLLIAAAIVVLIVSGIQQLFF